MKRFLVLFFAFLHCSVGGDLFAQNNVLHDAIGRSFDIRRIDFTNLSNETLPSGQKTYVFDFPSFNFSNLKNQGVNIIKSEDKDDGLDTFFILTDYDYETTLLDKIAHKCDLNDMALAMFSSAYDFGFKRKEDPDELIVYSSYYNKLYELEFDYTSHKLTDQFIDDVNRLGQDITAMGFIYRNGSHFAGKVHYGGHFILENKVSKDTYQYSGLTPKEFAEQIKINIDENNSGRQSKNQQSPNRIQVGISKSHTIGGDPSQKNLDAWIPTLSSNPQPIAVDLVRITELLTNERFPNVANLDYKRYVLDSLINIQEINTTSYRSIQYNHNFFNRPPIKFKQKVISIEKINSGFETDNDYTGILFMGFFGKDHEMLVERPLFDYSDGDMKSFFTEEVIQLNKILEMEVDSLDIKDGYVSVWDDAKKIVRGEDRKALRVSGSNEAQTTFLEAMNVVVTKTVPIQTIDDDRYEVVYTLERVKDYNLFDNTSIVRNDIMDSQLIAAVTNNEIERIKQMYRSGANKYARGVIQAVITSPQVSIDMLYAIMDEGVKPTTEDLEVAFDPDYFDPYIVLALLERGAKPKNNMIYKAVAYNRPEVISALIREGAKPINNDLDFAIRKKRYKAAKVIMGEYLEDYEPTKEAMDLAVENEDLEMVEKFIDLGGVASASTLAKAAVTAERNKDNTLVNLLAPITEIDSQALEAAARINDTELFKQFISENKALADDTSVELAIKNSNMAILQMALENKADPTKALEHAVEQNNKQAVILALQYKANPDLAFDFASKNQLDNLYNELLNTYQGSPYKALQSAVKYDNLQYAKTAISKNMPDVSPLLSDVAANKNTEWVKLLLDKGANPNQGISNAVIARKIDVTKLLLDGGADANQALQVAAEQRLPELVKMALDYGANPSLAIKTSVEQNDTESSMMLLDAGANPHDLLNSAVSNKNSLIVKRLLENDVNPQEAIVTAVESNSTKLVQMLIDKGADVSSTDLIQIGLENNNPDMCKLLFENGCEVFYKDNSGNTYLHSIAKKEGANELMRAFIEFGLDVNTKNKNGETPIHIAVQIGDANYLTVLELLKANADPGIKNKKRKTAFKLATGSKIKILLSDFNSDR